MRLKNEVLVGVFVVLGIIIAVAGAFWLSGRAWGREQMEVVAVFRTVGELSSGNPVKYRGVQVGRVTDISLSTDGMGVLVTMEVDATVELPAQPAVVLAPASLFGDWQASIVSYPTQGADLEFTIATAPGILPGATLPDITELTAVGARIAGNLETLAGRVELAFTEETAIKIRETIENVQQISEQLIGFVDQQTRTYDQVARSILTTAQNVEGTTERVGQIAVEIESAFQEGGQVQQILDNARLASQNLQELSTQLQTATIGVPGLIARADTTMVAVQTTLTEVGGAIQMTLTGVGGVMEGIGPQIQEVGPLVAEARLAVATLQRAAARIEQGEGTLGRLLEDPALYEETQAAIASLRRLMADVQANPARYIGALRIF
jgi:phospholipid/cholesterol/gamma-HCH transport system substrate-binding protein